MPETWVRSLGWEDPLEKEKATHSSILAWRIPWTTVTKNWTQLSNFHSYSLFLHFQEKLRLCFFFFDKELKTFLLPQAQYCLHCMGVCPISCGKQIQPQQIKLPVLRGVPWGGGTSRVSGVWSPIFVKVHWCVDGYVRFSLMLVLLN